ncbi:phospholipase D/nuclease [Polychaeton citri CBS 116435]|uniref:Phospholipase n=1 Tax=Polychaeton citri CBS 116435 TaxID=1314669 RepID=A0A9P4UT50_9PEZI|nr:phospholipase D/nuclease [Polychaeton citri CBS 116435]
MSFLFDKVKDAVSDVEKKFKEAGKEENFHVHTHHQQSACSDGDSHHLHRFQSFAPQREGNDVKWYVDGCGYMYAVSVALEQARESIWILDWWLSPELYLRRPPAKHEEFRVDRLLQRAANRGVQVHVIVYKEVTQALTLSSSHTKHWLEDNDKTGNIKVFRHPDHLPDKQTLASSFVSSLKQSGFSASKLAQLPGDALKGIYGMNEDTVLYWAHHEKLCLVDGHIAFMGGLDLCYGRWDTNQHSISDAHPSDLNRIVFPGQDYNNARIMDFQDVKNWQNNKLDRKYNSRMGWSDVSISLRGPVVEDLQDHFAQRWNFIYYEKYDVRKDTRYKPLPFRTSRVGIIGHPYRQDQSGQQIEGEGQYQGFRERMKQRMREEIEEGRAQFTEGKEVLQDRMYGRQTGYPSGPLGGMPCQIMRSCAKWSHGVALEHSIANAYIETIRNSQHFVYIENQFFITATNGKQHPIKNRIAAAIVERIVRAARNGEQYHMIVNIPAIPAFAGDLRNDDSLSTRAIMEFQYDSINRGGHSIYESIAREGFDPMDYIRFYNLRNYDRINSSSAMQQVENKAGINYDDARKGYDQRYGQAGGLDRREYGSEYHQGQQDAFNRYQEAAQEFRSERGDDLGRGRWDTVSECYMLGGEDIRNVPWEDGTTDEIDAFVSEELYIHSKLLIADDRIVICGSANLNDRSQLGDHDSEIAICIQDPQEIDSYMAGQPWKASKFAASLRRQLFRKHLGLVHPQDYQRPDANFMPIGEPNIYDWGSREDHAVADPLAPSFLNLWKQTARTNTDCFERVFHPVPTDKVRNWKEYDDYFERFFKAEKEGEKKKDQKPSTWKWGHVVAEEFAPGEQGAKEVKEVLSRVKGTLVEMPLLFLKEEDIAKEGLGLNAFTAEVYT